MVGLIHETTWGMSSCIRKCCVAISEPNSSLPGPGHFSSCLLPHQSIFWTNVSVIDLHEGNHSYHTCPTFHGKKWWHISLSWNRHIYVVLLLSGNNQIDIQPTQQSDYVITTITAWHGMYTSQARKWKQSKLYWYAEFATLYVFSHMTRKSDYPQWIQPGRKYSMYRHWRDCSKVSKQNQCLAFVFVWVISLPCFGQSIPELCLRWCLRTDITQTR